MLQHGQKKQKVVTEEPLQYATLFSGIGGPEVAFQLSGLPMEQMFTMNGKAALLENINAACSIWRLSLNEKYHHSLCRSIVKHVQ